jgi:hypothetical protein
MAVWASPVGVAWRVPALSVAGDGAGALTSARTALDLPASGQVLPAFRLGCGH